MIGKITDYYFIFIFLVPKTDLQLTFADGQESQANGQKSCQLNCHNDGDAGTLGCWAAGLDGCVLDLGASLGE